MRTSSNSIPLFFTVKLPTLGRLFRALLKLGWSRQGKRGTASWIPAVTSKILVPPSRDPIHFLQLLELSPVAIRAPMTALWIHWPTDPASWKGISNSIICRSTIEMTLEMPYSDACRLKAIVDDPPASAVSVLSAEPAMHKSGDGVSSLPAR